MYKLSIIFYSDQNCDSENTSPITAPAIATVGSAVTIAPVAAIDCKAANVLPAATFPIPAWIPAAREPAATPFAVKPAADRPIVLAAVATVPAIAPPAV